MATWPQQQYTAWSQQQWQPGRSNNGRPWWWTTLRLYQQDVRGNVNNVDDTTDTTDPCSAWLQRKPLNDVGDPTEPCSFIRFWLMEVVIHPLRLE
jgi:hypothetical protein